MTWRIAFAIFLLLYTMGSLWASYDVIGEKIALASISWNKRQIKKRTLFNFWVCRLLKWKRALASKLLFTLNTRHMFFLSWMKILNKFSGGDNGEREFRVIGNVCLASSAGVKKYKSCSHCFRINWVVYCIKFQWYINLSFKRCHLWTQTGRLVMWINDNQKLT